MKWRLSRRAPIWSVGKFYHLTAICVHLYWDDAVAPACFVCLRAFVYGRDTRCVWTKRNRRPRTKVLYLYSIVQTPNIKDIIWMNGKGVSCTMTFIWLYECKRENGQEGYESTVYILYTLRKRKWNWWKWLNRKHHFKPWLLYFFLLPSFLFLSFPCLKSITITGSHTDTRTRICTQ